jgi:hypothetical protein
MATVTYLYPVYSTVFHVHTLYGVREAVVSRLVVTVNNFSTDLNYVIQFKKMPGMDNNAIETDLHADLTSALAAYALLVPA